MFLFNVSVDSYALDIQVHSKCKTLLHSQKQVKLYICLHDNGITEHPLLASYIMYDDSKVLSVTNKHCKSYKDKY